MILLIMSDVLIRHVSMYAYCEYVVSVVSESSRERGDFPTRGIRGSILKRDFSSTFVRE